MSCIKKIYIVLCKKKYKTCKKRFTDFFALAANNSFQTGKFEKTDKTKWECAVVVNLSKKTNSQIAFVFYKAKYCCFKRY